MSAGEVTLLLPGFSLGALSGADIENNQSGAIEPDLPIAYQFSQLNEQRPWQADLAACLNIDTKGGQYLPSAALALQIDAQHRSDNFHTGLVRADPVYLKADKDNATLITSEQLTLSAQEADGFIDTFNELVAPDGLRFFRQGEKQWYLAGLSASGLSSYPPSFLANRKASSFLPDGEGAREWRRLMTEVQMLLHAHPMNEQRAQSGKLPINSVWFWGGAPAPAISNAHKVTRLYSDVEESLHLASHAGVECRELSSFTADIQSHNKTDHWLLLDRGLLQSWLHADTHALQRRLADITEQWLVPLSLKVRRGELSQIRVLSEDGVQGLCTAQTWEQSKVSVVQQVKAHWRAGMKNLLGR